MKIVLSRNDKRWVLLCKSHFEHDFKLNETWLNKFKPLFNEIYGWDPDEDENYQDFLNCLFNKLLDIFMVINDDQSLNNTLLKDLFDAAFYIRPGLSNDSPLERTILKLRSLIAHNTVTKDGVDRYDLGL